MISPRGVITAALFASGNIDERELCPELLMKVHGLVLGDKGYIRPKLKQDLRQSGQKSIQIMTDFNPINFDLIRILSFARI